MDGEKAVATLKEIALDKGLPHTEYALFGVRCPYCGKMDRIRPLEPPDEIEEILGEELSRYREAWEVLARQDCEVGICWFCRQVLRLEEDMTSAGPFQE